MRAGDNKLSRGCTSSVIKGAWPGGSGRRMAVSARACASGKGCTLMRRCNGLAPRNGGERRSVSRTAGASPGCRVGVGGSVTRRSSGAAITVGEAGVAGASVAGLMIVLAAGAGSAIGWGAMGCAVSVSGCCIGMPGCSICERVTGGRGAGLASWMGVIPSICSPVTGCCSLTGGMTMDAVGVGDSGAGGRNGTSRVAMGCAASSRRRNLRCSSVSGRRRARDLMILPGAGLSAGLLLGAEGTTVAGTVTMSGCAGTTGCGGEVGSHPGCKAGGWSTGRDGSGCPGDGGGAQVVACGRGIGTVGPGCSLCTSGFVSASAGWGGLPRDSAVRCTVGAGICDD